MIGILIIAHDSFGEGLARAVTHVLGSRRRSWRCCRSRRPTTRIRCSLPRVSWSKQLDSGHGVIIFSDIYGGSPSNLAAKLLKSGRVEGMPGSTCRCSCVPSPMYARHGDDGEARRLRRLDGVLT